MAELKPIRKMTKDCCLTVKIKIPKEFYIRLWLAKNLIRLAAFVLGMSANIKEEKVDG